MNPSMSLKSALHFFTLLDQKGTPLDQLQALYDTGLMADLLDANVDEVNRDEFRKVLGLMPTKPEFELWKTIVLGRHKTMDAYQKSIKAHRQIAGYANQLLGKTSISETEVEVDLVRASVRDLGFKKNTRLDAIMARAMSYGLEKCVAEVGPALADQYSDQPKGEFLAVAMDSIAGTGGSLSIFDVDHGVSVPWLDTYYGYPGRMYSPAHVFVFSRPRK